MHYSDDDLQKVYASPFWKEHYNKFFKTYKKHYGECYPEFENGIMNSEVMLCHYGNFYTDYDEANISYTFNCFDFHINLSTEAKALARTKNTFSICVPYVDAVDEHLDDVFEFTFHPQFLKNLTLPKTYDEYLKHKELFKLFTL